MISTRGHIDAWTVVVAMPAHDEECLGEFIAEIESHLSRHVRSLRFVVVDDASDVPVDLSGRAIRSDVTVLTNTENLGHGPSVLRAYGAAVAQRPDVVVHVDGDGQFLGSDFPALLAALADRDGAVGVRTGRADPWFRRLLSHALTWLLPRRARAGADVNTPLRAYHRDVVVELLDRVSPDALVPHVHWSLLHRRLALDVAAVPVTSRPRRGASAVGTMWRGGGRSWYPSRALIGFVRRALFEVVRMHGQTVTRATPVLDDDLAA